MNAALSDHIFRVTNGISDQQEVWFRCPAEDHECGCLAHYWAEFNCSLCGGRMERKEEWVSPSV